MKTFLHLQPVSPESPAFLRLQSPRPMASCRVYDLAAQDLATCGALLVSGHIDQRALATRSGQLSRFLDGGGILVFNGHVAYPFLPELAPFVPVPGYGLDLLQIRRVAPHPVFDGVAEQDLTYRRGVAGFYGRGHNPPPPGATVLHRLSGHDAPLDWVWQRPAGGTLFMHGGNNLWMYVEDTTSAARIAPQLLDWLDHTLTAQGD